MRQARAVSCPPPCSAPEQPRGTAEALPGFWGLDLENQSRWAEVTVTARTLLLPALRYPTDKRQHPTREGLGSFLDLLSTYGGAARGSSSSSPFVGFEEQPEGGLRHCTPPWHGSQLTTHPNWPRFTNTSSGSYKPPMKNRLQLVVVTLPLSVSWCPTAHSRQAVCLSIPCWLSPNTYF